MATQPTNLPVPSESSRDLKFNAGKIDEFVTSLVNTYVDRLGNEHYTIEGLRWLAQQAISQYGWIPVGTFQAGSTLTIPNEILKDETDGEYYRWDGSFLPSGKVVPPGSTPSSTGGVGVGGWLAIGDSLFRTQLASYVPPGTDLIGTTGGVNLTQYLARNFIFLDDILPSKDGSSDCSVALNAKLLELSGAGVTFIGNRSSTYRFDDTINFTGVSNTKLDFNFATVLDNVQGVIAGSGRGNSTFVVYDCSNIEICNITYDKASTRSNSVDTNIPTHVFWIGGQYLGSAMTRHIYVHDVEVNASIFKGCVLAGTGELDGVDVRKITVNGGDWRFGCNFEYGEQPTDPATNPSMTNGRHPYNIYVEQFNGTTLLSCDGFLRVASTYNVKFFNCTGYNTKSFVYVYGGDRSISRFSENVIFENCKDKIDPSVLTAINYSCTVVIVNKDGSTTEPLPAWTNYNHTIRFVNCEFLNNSTTNSTCVRFYGNKGTTVFESCIFRNSYYGVNAGPGSNPDYTTVYGLAFRNCLFINNMRDIYTLNIIGVLFDHCQFKDQNASSVLTPVFLDANTLRCLFSSCAFLGIKRSGYYVLIPNVSSIDNKFDNCYFEMFTTLDRAINTLARTYGSRNSSSGLVTTNDSASQRGLIGDNATRIRDMALFSGTYVHADVGDYFTSIGTYNLSTVLGGTNGMTIVLRGAGASSSVTLRHNASGVSIDQRILLLSGADRVVTGNTWSVTLRKLENGWWEI
ncbi:hypothetical protein V8J08_005006 [Citrobacter amalonaticus]